MPVATHGVSELVIEAKDLAASERFYTQALGLPVVLRWEGEAWTGREAVWVQSGEQTRIGLWKPAAGISGARPGAHVHFALTVVEEDYDAMVAQSALTARTSTRSTSVTTQSAGHALRIHGRSRRPPRGDLDPKHRHPDPSRSPSPRKRRRARHRIALPVSVSRACGQPPDASTRWCDLRRVP